MTFLRLSRCAGGLLILAVLAITGAATAAGPIKLLRDIRPGYFPDDSREVVRVDTTTDTVYMLSVRRGLETDRNTIFLNYSNAVDPESHVGWPVAIMYGHRPWGSWLTQFPAYIFRDGKAVFPHASSGPWQYVELDGATGSVVPLTPPQWETGAPFATWIGTGGAVCFASLNQFEKTWQIGRLDNQGNIMIAHSIPWKNPDDPSPPFLGATVVLGDKLLFIAEEDESASLSLYATDGTSTGTVLVYSVTSPEPAYISLKVALGQCFFLVAQADQMAQLYVSDGTAEGTSLVGENPPYSYFDYGTGATAESSSTLYWAVPGAEVSYTDGTTPGALPAPEDSHTGHQYDAEAIYWVGSKLYVMGPYSDSHPGKLFVSDGRSTPTPVHSAMSPVSNIYATRAVTSGTIIRSHDSVYFTPDELENAVLLSSTEGLPQWPDIADFNGHAVYNVRTAGAPYTDQVYLSQPANPWAPRQITSFTSIPISSDPGNYIEAAGRLFFSGGVAQQEMPDYTNRSYCIDPAGETLRDFTSSNIEWLGKTPVGPIYRYLSDSGSDVYVMDPAAVGLGFKRIYGSGYSQGQQPAPLFDLGNECYFSVTHYGSMPYLVWTNGTPAGTQYVEFFLDDMYLEGNLKPVGVAGGKGFFYGKNTNGDEPKYPLWSVAPGGANAEPAVVKVTEFDHPPTEGAALPDGRIVFAAAVTASGPDAVYASNGTAGSLNVLSPAGAGSSGQQMSHFVSGQTQVFYFQKEWATAPDRDASPVEQVQTLSRTDGTPGGTAAVSSALGRFLDRPDLQLMSSQHGGVYAAGVAEDGRSRVIYSDGTGPGTRLVADLPPTARPKLLAEVSGWMYLAVTTPELGRELYRTAGHTGSIELVQNLAPGPASGAVMEDAYAMGTRLFFAGYDNGTTPTGRELYYLDVLDTGVEDWALYQ